MPVKIIPTYKVTIKAGILGGGSGFVTWPAVLDKPTEFPPAAHTHPTSQVDGLDAALAAVQSSVGNVYTKTESAALYISKPAPASANQVLTYDGSNWAAKAAPKATAADIQSALGYTPANPSAISMAGLSDVQFTGLSDGDIAVFNSNASKWQNVPQTKITDGGNF